MDTFIICSLILGFAYAVASYNFVCHYLKKMYRMHLNADFGFGHTPETLTIKELLALKKKRNMHLAGSLVFFAAMVFISFSRHEGLTMVLWLMTGMTLINFWYFDWKKTLAYAKYSVLNTLYSNFFEMKLIDVFSDNFVAEINLNDDIYKIRVGFLCANRSFYKEGQIISACGKFCSREEAENRNVQFVVYKAELLEK